jgi:hypothetical protein
MFIVGVAHCDSKVPLREFYVPWKRYYKACVLEKYPFVARTCGITFIQIFSIFFPFILSLENSGEIRNLCMGQISLISVELC